MNKNFNESHSIDTYLAERGIALTKFGSAEFGLSRQNTILFLNCLSENNKSPIGIEVWRYIDEEYSLDALDGWYSTQENDGGNSDSAMKFVLGAALDAKDVMTVQFD